MSEVFERPFRVRLGKVRLKAGGAELRVFRHPDTTSEVRREVDAVIAGHGDVIAGCAFVVWAPDGGSTCALLNFPSSPWPKPLVPDFVARRLYAELVEHWTRQGLRENPVA